MNLIFANRHDASDVTVRFFLIGSFALSLIKFRKDLIRSLIAKDIDVHVAVPIAAEDHWILDELETMGATVHKLSMVRTGTNPFADLFALFELWQLIGRVKPSHVLSYTIKPIVHGSLAARLARVPNRFALVTGRGYAFEDNQRKFHIGGLAQWLYKVSLKYVAVVMFQNSDDEALFVSKGLISASTGTCVLNGSGVNLDEYPITPLPGDVSFLMIARLLGAKGIREFVSAARKVRSGGHDAKFRVVGWIDDNPDSVSGQELEAWKSEGIVEFLGKQTDVRPSIASSSVYVLPSYREGTPRTVLEAMSMGRPVITTDAPGCRETVADGDNGFLVPVKSVDELASAMLRFVEDPGLAENMGRRSREIAEERYDVHKVNKAMLSVMGIE